MRVRLGTTSGERIAFYFCVRPDQITALGCYALPRYLQGQVSLARHYKDWQLFWQVIIQLLDPALDLGNRLSGRLARVNYHKCCMGTSVVSRIETAVLLLTQSVPNLQPAFLSFVIVHVLHL